MINFIIVFGALTGLGFAGYAALVPDTGVDGTIGSYLALLGTVGVVLFVRLAVFLKLPSRNESFILGLIALSAILTGLAGWFLMQQGVVASMVVILVGVLARLLNGRPLSWRSMQ